MTGRVRLSVTLLVIAAPWIGTLAFKEANDGARIVAPPKKPTDSSTGPPVDSYTIPLRSTLKPDNKPTGAGPGDQPKNAKRDFDDAAEFTLLSRMKTMEIPPPPSAMDYYASAKYAALPSSSRFRQRRSLKFDDGNENPGNHYPGSDNNGGPQFPAPNNNGAQFSSPPRSPSTGDKYDGTMDPNSNVKDAEQNKRLFPELFGIHGPPHYYPSHHYHPYHPTGGYYPGGAGYYPGAGGYYPGGGVYGPGVGGLGASGSAAAQASASAGGVGGFRPVNSLYGTGYYPGGYGGTYYPPPGGVAPILGGPGTFGFGGFRDESGKGGSVANEKPGGGGGVSGSGVTFGE